MMWRYISLHYYYYIIIILLLQHQAVLGKI